MSNRRSLKTRESRALTAHTPIGGILTDDAGIITGKVVVYTEYNAEADHTNVFIRPKGGESKLSVTGAPVPGDMETETVLARLRLMNVERTETGAFKPFSF